MSRAALPDRAEVRYSAGVRYGYHFCAVAPFTLKLVYIISCSILMDLLLICTPTQGPGMQGAGVVQAEHWGIISQNLFHRYVQYVITRLGQTSR